MSAFAPSMVFWALAAISLLVATTNGVRTFNTLCHDPCEPGGQDQPVDTFISLTWVGFALAVTIGSGIAGTILKLTGL